MDSREMKAVQVSSAVMSIGQPSLLLLCHSQYQSPNQSFVPASARVRLNVIAANNGTIEAISRG